MNTGTVTLQVHSDLHVEFSDVDIPNRGADALILAGDIGTFNGKLDVREWLRKTCDNFDQVLMIPGNHEYYGTSIERVEGLLSSLDLPGFVYMQEMAHEINGVLIAGCTLWTDMNRKDMDTVYACAFGMNDYAMIKHADLRLTPFHTCEFHLRHKEFLNNIGSAADVIMTHHLPTMQSHDVESHGEGVLKWAYGSDADKLIEKIKPQVWIHGHTHHSVMYEHKPSGVPILSNARGYQAPGYHEECGWVPELVLTVESKNNNNKGDSDEVPT